MLNNEAQLKAGFNSNATRTGDPLDNVNEFCENMHFVMTQVEFDCLSAAVQIYHSDELVDPPEFEENGDSEENEEGNESEDEEGEDDEEEN
jgi:hypothetical protein